MTERELNDYYADEYRADYAEPRIEERYAADVSEALTRVERLAPILTEASSLLEVGAGTGAFLEAVKSYVPNTAGIEPEKAARKWLGERRTRVLSSLDALEDERFDVIVLFHVLEHVLDPIAFLRRLTQHLNPGGKLVVEVPNVEDALVAAYRVAAYLPFYYQKAHLFYFSARTLKQVASLAGLDAEIEGIQRYGLGNHLHWMLTGEPGGQGSYANVLAPGAEAAYAKGLIERGYSDTLWAIAQVEGSGVTATSGD